MSGKDLEVGPTATPPRKFSLERFKTPVQKLVMARTRNRGEKGRGMSEADVSDQNRGD